MIVCGVASVVGAMCESGRAQLDQKEMENEMRDIMGAYEAIAFAHESEARVAERYDLGRVHDVDIDPRRFTPSYHCPGGG